MARAALCNRCGLKIKPFCSNHIIVVRNDNIRAVYDICDECYDELINQYTIKDIIYDPDDPRLIDAIGKECYRGTDTSTILSKANANDVENLAVLDSVDKNSNFPFCLQHPDFKGCYVNTLFIVLKKEEHNG